MHGRSPKLEFRANGHLVHELAWGILPGENFAFDLLIGDVSCGVFEF